VAKELSKILAEATKTRRLNSQEGRAKEWFRQVAASTVKSNLKATLLNSKYKSNALMPGTMCMFMYDPKTKKDLPYYDTFPLLLPYSYTANGFIGLNLHYLARPLRAALMDALYDFTTDKNYDDNTRLAFSYKLLKSSTRYKYFEPCLKQYLYSHVRSKFVIVPPNEWDIALFLPTENFQKAPKQKVHSDSAKIIGL
jgi:hypothetical protein